MPPLLPSKVGPRPPALTCSTQSGISGAQGSVPTLSMDSTSFSSSSQPVDGRTDRQWVSEPQPGMAALLLMNRGRAAGRQRACVSRRPAAHSKVELGPPGRGEDSPGPCGGRWDRSSPSRGAFTGTNTDREYAERRLPDAESKLGAMGIMEAFLEEGVQDSAACLTCRDSKSTQYPEAEASAGLQTPDISERAPLRMAPPPADSVTQAASLLGP